MRRPGPLTVLSLCLSLALYGCVDETDSPPDVASSGGEQAPDQGPVSTANPGFEVWHDDFPFELHISPRNRSGRYSFSSRQALQRLVDRLDGNWTREGWEMAREFFNHAPDDAIPILIESMDKAMQAQHLQDRVQNTVEAMGRMGRYRSEEMAEALLRALQHRKVSVQNSAMGALAQAGTPSTVLAAQRFLGTLQLRAFHDWLRAVRNHVPDQREEIFAELLRSEDSRLFSLTVEQTLKMEPAAAARVLGPIWGEVKGPLLLSLAIVLHAVGDPRGTEVVIANLASDDDDAVLAALGAVTVGDLAHLKDDVLKLSVHQNPNVRAVVASLIANLPGDNIENILDLLAVDASPEVRQYAVSALWHRGAVGHGERLIEAVRTGTGSKLVRALADLSAARIGEAIPVMYERMLASPPEEWKKFIQAIGRSGAPEAFAPLKDIFMMPEQAIDRTGEYTSMTYAAVLLPNLLTARDALADLLGELPREDYRRRAWLMHRIGVVAAEDEGSDFRSRVFDEYRATLANTENIPQLRLLALEYLRRDLSLDDMQRIKKMQDAEVGTMRRVLVDFLYEFF